MIDDILYPEALPIIYKNHIFIISLLLRHMAIISLNGLDNVKPTIGPRLVFLCFKQISHLLSKSTK